MNKKQLIIAAALIAAGGCEEAGGDAVSPAEPEIVYSAPAGMISRTEGAPDPAGAVMLDDDTWAYVDRAARMIVKVTGTRREDLADLSVYEEALSADTCWADYWGNDVILIGGRIVIAGRGHALMFVDPSDGSAEVVGRPGGVRAGEGSRVGDVDFGDFSGFGRAESGAYFIFDNRLYFAAWDGDSAHLADAVLEYRGGGGEIAGGEGDASNIRFSFSRYTPILADGDRLYFWEQIRLRAYENGRVLTVTGEGDMTPGGTLDAFFAQELPDPPRIFKINGDLYSPYWRHSDCLIRIHIESLDFERGEAAGTTDCVSLPNISWSNMAPRGGGWLVTDAEAGSFWQVSGDLSDGVRLFGAENSAERAESMDKYGDLSPYAVPGIVGPMAIETWVSDRAALIYAPTMYQLIFMNLKSAEWATMTYDAVSAMATDGERTAWYQAGSSLKFMTIEDSGDVLYEGVSKFFVHVDETGAPCRPPVFRLTENPRLGAGRHVLMMYGAEADRVFRYGGEMISGMHGSGWVKPGSTESYSHAGLDMTSVTDWAVSADAEFVLQDYEGGQILTAVNLTAAPLTIGGAEIDGGDCLMIAGTGDFDAAPGVRLADSRLPKSSEIDAAWDGTVYLRTESDLLYDDGGVWAQVPPPCAAGMEGEDFRVGGPAGDRFYTERRADGVYRCDEASGQWSAVSVQPGAASPCMDRREPVIAAPGRVCAGSDHCAVLPPGFEPESVTCNDGGVYISGRIGGGYAVFRAALDRADGAAELFGRGIGLEDKMALSKAKFGRDVGRMIYDGRDALYFWTKDTCSIWKIPGAGRMDGDSTMYRVVTDQKLCNADAVSVSASGRIAMFSDHKLYELEDGAFRAAAGLESDVYDMTDAGGRWVVMASDGLYIYDRYKFRMAMPSPAVIDGHTVDFAVRGAVPRMSYEAGENAVLIPVFSGGRIIRIRLGGL